MAHNDRLRRSLLFVPGSDARKIDRSRDVAADTVIFDLEDAVPVERKEEARRLVVGALRAGRFGTSELAVRVNAAATPFFMDDVAAMVAAGAQTLLIPKVESASGLGAAERVVAAAEGAHHRTAGAVRLLALVETPLGIIDAHRLSAATARLDGLCFGHADFALDMGVAADASAGVVLHARCQLAIAAKASAVAPIDCVYLTITDEAAFRADTLRGRSLGFEGKLCIHPTQVRVANEVHTPTHDEVAFARRVVEAWESAGAQGRGAIAVDGKMIDAPLAAAQQRVLERAQRAGVLG
jgi:citrate lyase subunit beta / citryl-CoA lyase